jgi:hypothetical protein
MAIGPEDLRPGMVVCDVRGRRLGHVGEVRDGHFTLATEPGEEFRLSIADIFTVADDQVTMIFGDDTLKRHVLD